MIALVSMLLMDCAMLQEPGSDKREAFSAPEKRTTPGSVCPGRSSELSISEALRFSNSPVNHFIALYRSESCFYFILLTKSLKNFLAGSGRTGTRYQDQDAGYAGPQATSAGPRRRDRRGCAPARWDAVLPCP